MLDKDNWKEIFLSIKKNKLRTFLSGFSVALGILLFVILFGFGNGLTNTFRAFFKEDAVNVFKIRKGLTSRPYKGYKNNRKIEFYNSDLEEIKENFSMFIEYITPVINHNHLTKYKNEFDNYQVKAIAPSYQYSEKNMIKMGRYIEQKDILEKTKIAVIGRMVHKDLFKDEEPIGKYIDINSTMYRVVGVFEDSEGDDEERVIYIPYTTKQQIEKNNDKISQIVLGFKPSMGYEKAIAFKKSLDNFLRYKKNVHPEDRRAIRISNLIENVKQNEQFSIVLKMIVSFVALGTIIAGIIGISNVMVFTVKERTKELGIRKALGATPKKIIGTILLESIFITTVSGVIGMLVGVGILRYIGVKLERFFITNPYIDMNWAIIATIILIIFGALAGYMPARRAALIKPIIALRDK